MDPMNACREVLGRSGSTFAMAFNILPPARRDAMIAFYAFCREVDDAVDETADDDLALKVLDEWRERVDLVYRGRPSDPVSQALQDAVDRFDIQRRHLELVLEGVEQDLTRTRCEKFDDLYEYCYRVASAVGLVCVTVLGETSASVALYAELTGIAVQLTNILRDVGEDASMGRIYLPLEDLSAFKVSEEDVLSRRPTAPMKRLLRFEALRARHFDEMAVAALPPESRHGLFFAEALRATYRELLSNMEADDFPVFSRRVSVSPVRRLVIALSHRLHPGTWI